MPKGYGSPFEAFVQGALERKSPERAKEGTVVRTIRHAAMVAGLHGPNPDLTPLANNLGVASIRVVPLAMEGRVLTERGRLVVEINLELDAFRRQFAIAHELVHIALRAYSERHPAADVAEPLWESHEDLEQICDWGAEELVAPRSWLKDALDPLHPSLRTLEDLAKKSGMPVDFLACRLIRLGHWGGQLVWCVQGDRGLSLVRRYPAADGRDLYDDYYKTRAILPIEDCLRGGDFSESYVAYAAAGTTHIIWTQCIPLESVGALALSILSREVNEINGVSDAESPHKESHIN